RVTRGQHDCNRIDSGRSPTTDTAGGRRLCRADRRGSCRRPRAPLSVKGATRRHESTITSLSWIPSEAVEGSTKVAFETGLAHYDEPPPEQIEDLAALRDADRFRFANVLKAWIDVDGSGKIVDCGYSGCGMMGS